MTRGGRGLVRVAAALGLAVGALVGLAGPASAHATLVSSSPGNGTTVLAAPSDLVLSLSESVELASTRLSLTTGTGSVVPLGAPRIVHLGDAEDTETPVEVVVALPMLAPDVYRLSWRTLSSDDLHTTSGVVVFGVQRPVAPAAAAPSGEPHPGPSELALRWAGLAGTATLLGCFAVGALLRPADGPGAHLRRIRRRLARVALGAGLVAVVADVGLLLEQVTGRNGIGTAWRLISSTAYGPRWLLLQVGLLTLVVLAARKAGLGARTGGAPLRPRQRWQAGLATAAVGVGTALTGHAAVAAGHHLTRVAATSVHVVAAYVWAGSLVAVVLGLGPHGRGAAGSSVRPAVLRRFGVLAVSCVVVLAGTGLLIAADQVATVDAALYSWYGRTLMLKTGVFLAAGGLGLTSMLLLRPGWSRLVLRRDVPSAWARGLLVTEAAVLLVVLGLAGGLASEQPARGAAWTPPRASGPVVSGNADDLVEQLALAPNVPGRTFLTVGVYDSRRPAPGRIDRVLVTFTSPEGRSVTRAAAQGVLGAAPTSGAPAVPDGWVVAGDDVSAAGTWLFTVRVQRAGLPDAVATYTWSVPDGAVRVHPVRVSDHPLGSLLRGGALALVVAVTAVLLAALLVRGPLRVPDPVIPDPRARSDADERIDA